MLESIGQFTGAGLALISVVMLTALFLAGPWNLYESPLLEILLGHAVLNRLQEVPDAELSETSRQKLGQLIRRDDLHFDQAESETFALTQYTRYERLQRFLRAEFSDDDYAVFVQYKLNAGNMWVQSYVDSLSMRSLDDIVRRFDRDKSRAERFLFGLAYRDYAQVVARRVFRTVSSTVTDWTTGGVLVATLSWLFAEFFVGDQSFLGYVGSGAALGAFLGLGRGDTVLVDQMWPASEDTVVKPVWRYISIGLLLVLAGPASAFILLNGAHLLAEVFGPAFKHPELQQATTPLPPSSTTADTTDGQLSIPTRGRLALLAAGLLFLCPSIYYAIRKLRTARSPVWQRLRKLSYAGLGVAAAMVCFEFSYIRGQQDKRVLALVLTFALMASFLIPFFLYGLSVILQRRQRRRPDLSSTNDSS